MSLEFLVYANLVFSIVLLFFVLKILREVSTEMSEDFAEMSFEEIDKKMDEDLKKILGKIDNIVKDKPCPCPKCVAERAKKAKEVPSA